MKRKPAQELAGIERERLLSIVITVVLVRESDRLTVESEEPMFGDGDAMCVPRQICKDLSWTTEGRLCVDNPVERACLLEKRRPIEAGRTLAKRRVLAKSLSKQTEKTTSKVTRQNFDRQQEVLATYDGEAAIRN